MCSNIEFSARKGLEIIYKIPVDSVLYNSECHVSARSLRARRALVARSQLLVKYIVTKCFQYRI